MRKIIVLTVLYFIMLGQGVKAQFYFFNDKYYENPLVLEIGAAFGVMNSLTDLGGKKGIGKGFIKDLTWKFAKPSFGIYAMAMYKYAIGFRLEGTFGEVKGYDSVLKDVKASTFGRYERNLSFKSRISDFQLAVEVHPLFFKNYEDDPPPPISPYVVAGIGYFSFDPKAMLNGQWYSLQPLRTEGQGFAEYPDRKPYKLKQVNFAAGIGVKYELSSMFNARFEVNHRFLKTDYLDDVSKNFIDPALFFNYLPANRAAIAQKLAYRQNELIPSDMVPVGEQRGDPADDDAFFTIQLKLGFTLGRQRR